MANQGRNIIALLVLLILFSSPCDDVALVVEGARVGKSIQKKSSLVGVNKMGYSARGSTSRRSGQGNRRDRGDHRPCCY
ncbi:hypothetical protein LINPERHAP1_LOCUS27091 [Linum perenne]